MHTVYRLYNFFCTFHLPTAIIILLFNVQGSFQYLDIIQKSNSVFLTNPQSLSIISQESSPHTTTTTTINNNKNSSGINSSRDEKYPHDHSYYDDCYHYYYSNLNQRSFFVMESTTTLSAVYFISCVSALLYAIVYLSIFNDDENNSSNSNGVFLRGLSNASYFHISTNDNSSSISNSDLDDNNSDIMSNGNNSVTKNSILLTEMSFWSFLITYSYTAIASTTLRLGTMEFFYLRLLIHLFCIYTIILGSPQMYAITSNKKVDIIGSIAFIAFIGETFLVISMAGAQKAIVMAYLHRFLDCLLILGHRWDTNPSWEIICNCRLFYLAIGGSLLHADMILTSPLLAADNTDIYNTHNYQLVL